MTNNDNLPPSDLLDKLPLRFRVGLATYAEHLLEEEIPDAFIERHNGHLWGNKLGNSAERRAWLREAIAVVRVAQALGLLPRRPLELEESEGE